MRRLSRYCIFAFLIVIILIIIVSVGFSLYEGCSLEYAPYNQVDTAWYCEDIDFHFETDENGSCEGTLVIDGMKYPVNLNFMSNRVYLNVVIDETTDEMFTARCFFMENAFAMYDMSNNSHIDKDVLWFEKVD